jgi:hypothetical protein
MDAGIAPTLSARDHVEIETLPPGVARLMAASLLKSRIEILQLKARIRRTIDATLRGRVGALEAALASLTRGDA